jgi:dienelactone hydrolase
MGGNFGFMDYAMPRADTLPLLATALSEVLAPTNRLGVRSGGEGLFARAGTAGEIDLYPGVHHGFAFPQRSCYDKPAAERHWKRLIALYRRCLE